jgi:transcription initiation factor IIE alpha subunit
MSRSPFLGAVAAHVLAAMSFAQRNGRSLDLEYLSTSLGARRTDVRRVLGALYREDMIDLSRMRLTFAGFAIGTALEARKLRPLRHSLAGHIVAA